MAKECRENKEPEKKKVKVLAGTFPANQKELADKRMEALKAAGLEGFTKATDLPGYIKVEKEADQKEAAELKEVARAAGIILH